MVHGHRSASARYSLKLLNDISYLNFLSFHDLANSGTHELLVLTVRHHQQLRIHLSDFVAAYNFAKRLKTMASQPTSSSAIAGKKYPDRFTLDHIHQMPGLNA
jgi:hypothetical protein